MVFALIPIVLGIMILYDFHLHVIETISGSWEKAWNRKYYWPPSKIANKKESSMFYNIFWTSYWGLAFILVLIYVFTV